MPIGSQPGLGIRPARLLSHLRTPLYGSAYALVASAAATSVLGIVYWTLAARLYTPVQVGTSAAAISAMTFISYVTQVNMAGVLSRFLPVAGAATQRMIAVAYLTSGAVSAIGAIVFVGWIASLVGLGTIVSTDVGASAWFIVATVAWSVFAIQDGALTGLRRTGWVPIENSVFGLAKIALLVAFSRTIAGTGIFLSWTIPALALVLPVNWLIFRRFVPRHAAAAAPGSSRGMPGGIVRYAWGDYLGALFYSASIGLLPLVVVSVVGAQNGAYFYIAWTIAASLYFASWSMSTSLMVEGAARRANLAADARRMLRLLIGLQLLLVLVVVIDAPLILTVFSPVYASEASTLLRLLGLAVIPHGINSIYLALARVQRQVGRIVLVQATLASLALGASIPLVAALGFNGAGVAWLAAQSLVAAHLFVYQLLPLVRGRPSPGHEEPGAIAVDDRPPTRPAAIPPILARAYAGFDAAEIEWCLLRGDPEDLAHGARDIDLLVARGDWPRASGVLTGLGMLRVPGYGRGAAGFFVGREPSDGTWVRLDVCTDLSFGRLAQYDTGLGQGCISRRRRHGSILVPAPDDAFWALILHCVLDKGHVADRHAARLRALADEVPEDAPIGVDITSILPTDWNRARIAAAVRSGSWDDLLALRGTILRRLVLRDPIGTTRRALDRSVRRGGGYARLAWRRWGISVALMGPDGAGKTTLAAGVAADFGLPVCRVYMGMWSRSNPGLFGRVPGLSIAARPFAAWRKALVAQYHRARGRLVIFDRYTYDALIPPRSGPTTLKRMYFWVLAHAAPAPQMVIVLDAPGALLYARKGEFDPARLEADRLSFLALRDRLRGVEVVDATQGPDAVRREVTDLIWQQFLRDAGDR